VPYSLEPGKQKKRIGTYTIPGVEECPRDRPRPVAVRARSPHVFRRCLWKVNWRIEGSGLLTAPGLTRPRSVKTYGEGMVYTRMIAGP
jgi:hypothetical protein